MNAASLRQAGQEAFEALGYPTRKTESWKYTPVRQIAETKWEAAAPQLGAAPAGSDVDIDDSADVLDSLGFGQVASLKDAPFVALNTAHLSRVTLLDIDEALADRGPVETQRIGLGPGSAAHSRLMVVVRAGVKATLVERWSALDGAVALPSDAAAWLDNWVTEVVLEKGACLEHILIRDADHAGQLVGTLAVRCHEGATYTQRTLAVGGGIDRIDLDVELAEPGAACHLDAILAPGRGQHFDLCSRVHHAAPDCVSRQMVKGLVGGGGHVVFRGNVVVAEGASGTDSEQANHNLLLSLDAEVDTKPQLEIFNDDVKCAHGATVGQLDEAQLFYLRSRGIGTAEATRMIIEGFAADLLEGVGLAPLREELHTAFTGHLGAILDAEASSHEGAL